MVRTHAVVALLLAGCAGASTGPPLQAAGASPCDGLPVIRFSEHLCERLASQTKRITLRARHRTQIASGQRVQLVCMESRRRWQARVTLVRHATWATISDQELRDDGFSGREQLLPVMRRYYPGIAAADPATVYRWGQARACATRHGPGVD